MNEAFDQYCDQAKLLYRQLGQDPEVREAIISEEAAEKTRLAAETHPQAEERQPRLEMERQNGPSILRFIRDTWIGQLVPFWVEIDDNYVGDLPFGSTLTVSVSPGEHHLRVYGGGAFFGKDLDILVGPDRVISWKVGYTLLGGVKLTRSRKPKRSHADAFPTELPGQGPSTIFKCSIEKHC